jgi:predicted nucleic acid-binding Zn ribbon protein
VNPATSCSVCGAAITPAKSFISETGDVCATCFGRWEVEQRATQNVVAQREAILLRKASRLGQLQGLNAAVAIILLAGWVHVPGWLSGILIAAVIAISYGMRLRSQVAFRAMLFLDSAGSLVFAGVSISQLSDARLFFLLFPVVFGWWLGFLTWRARDVFVAPSRLEIRG